MLWAIVFWWYQVGPENGELLMAWGETSRVQVGNALKRRGAELREQPVRDAHEAEEFQAAVRARVVR
jgi:hypothetical protein